MDQTLVDQLPILAIVLSFGVMVYLLVQQRRRRVPTECWFCGHVEQIEREKTNSWTCSSCEQYNGFNSDGDYNTTVPEFYDEKLNKKPRITRNAIPLGSLKLCEKCFHREQFKLQARSNFSPLSPKDYDTEEREYLEDLERTHKLCPNCQKLVEDELVINQKIVVAHKIGRRKTAADTPVNSVTPWFKNSFDFLGMIMVVAALGSALWDWRADSTDTTTNILSALWVVTGIAFRTFMYPSPSLAVGVPDLLILTFVGGFMALGVFTLPRLSLVLGASLTYNIAKYNLPKILRSLFLTLMYAKRYRSPYVTNSHVSQSRSTKQDSRGVSRLSNDSAEDIDKIFANVGISEPRKWSLF